MVSLCGVNGDDVTAENLECKNIEKIVYNVVEILFAAAHFS